MADVQAGIYCRMSLAIMNDKTKVADQERLCRITAEQLGWRIYDVYQDNNRGAWQHNRKRPAWERMLADIEAGKITAIIVYHGDRLVRQPWDLELLISLSRTRGIKLASPTGVHDLNNAEDQMVLGIQANVYRHESATISRRRKAQYERMRREGRVRTGGTGGRAYAFQTDGVTIIDSEAALLREAATLILSGTATGSVASWLNSQGATSVTGKPFTQIAVKRLLTHARYAGLMPDGITPAAWPPIIDRGDWETICGTLTARAAKHTTGPARYLLSGLAVCGNCGRTLQAHASGGGVAYACRHCWKVFRNMTLLDTYVGRRVWQRQNHPALPGPQAPPGLAGEFNTLTRARAELAAKIADPAQPYVDLLTARLQRLDERIVQLRDSTADAARQRLIRQHQGITWEEWLALPLQTRRALVNALFKVEVLPATHRGPGFNPRDVHLTPL